MITRGSFTPFERRSKEVIGYRWWLRASVVFNANDEGYLSYVEACGLSNIPIHVALSTRDWHGNAMQAHSSDHLKTLSIAHIYNRLLTL